MKRLHGVVSLLDAQHDAKVAAMWDELEAACGLAGIKITPIPHFSWQIAENYRFERLDTILKEITLSVNKLTVRTSGLALFTGENPVVYLPIIRDASLSALHAKIWESLFPVSVAPSPYYSPQSWMPHITLAHKDVDRNTLTCLMDRLAFQNHNWELSVDNLAVVYQPEGQVGLVHSKFKFGG
jgi:2'-5' RNA ligase